MPFIACKLPNGLQITHNGETITLLGANIGENLGLVSANGLPLDHSSRASGYGLTEITDRQAEAFADWSNKVTYKDGVKEAGKLADPFPALENGSILGPFKSEADARKEVVATASMVTSGFEGLDPSKEGVEEDKEAGAGKSGRK